jgi:hypothetical protein
LPKSTYCFRAHSPIIDLAVLNNDTIIFSTKQSGIRVLDIDDYSVLSNILPQELDMAEMTLFSPNGNIIALVNKNTIKIMLLKSQKIIKTIQIADQKILTLHFDASSEYLFVGTSEGRVLQYRYNSNTQLSRLCSFPYHFPDEKPQKVKDNFVSVINSYKNKIAATGYGGTIYVMDLYTRNDKIIINRSRIRIETLCFIDEHTLISGNIDGVLEIIDLSKPKNIRRLNAPFTKIKHITPMPNKDYILVASDKKFISLINIKTLKVIDNKYLEFDEKIQKLVKKDEQSLLVVLQDKSVQNIELVNLATLRKFIASNKLYQAYRLLAKAPMLRGSQEEKDLEHRYQDTLQQTIALMLEENTHAAQELVKSLRTIPAKKNEIELIFTAFQQYKKFQLMFHEQKLNIAYSMCDKFPALKSTREYKSMERQWQEVFKKAEKEMMLNNTESARVLLNDYLLVSSKRTLIQFILYKNKEFIKFLQAIKKKEFKQLSNLAKEHQTFASLQHYQSLHNELHNNFLEAQRLIQIGNTHLAQVIIDELEENPKYESLTQTLQTQCDAVEELYVYYNQDKLKKCYTLLDKNKFLKTTDLGIYLEEKWNYLIKNCEVFALKGQLNKIESELDELKKLSSRSDKIGDILRLAHQRKISHFLHKTEFKSAKEEIQNYIALFGLDIEIQQLMQEYNNLSNTKLNLSHEQTRYKPRDYWLYA